MEVLAIVLGWHEGTVAKELRDEINRLKAELSLWKGETELPKVGNFYFAPDSLFQIHGWSFLAETTALRYDGSEWRCIERHDGTKLQIYEHVFTSAYEYGAGDVQGRSGFITFRFTTPELHQLYCDEIQFFSENVRYLDANDNVCFTGVGQQMEEDIDSEYEGE